MIQMQAHSIPDECEALDVETLDRSEIIAKLRTLEAQRSAWELRIRVAQEREDIWKDCIKELSMILAETFDAGHAAISAQAERAAVFMEELQQISKNVEDK